MSDPVASPVAATVDPLVIRHLDFLGPQVTKGGWRPVESFPEIAFAGRSNVGKSSLLNTLLKRKALARVSNTPGRTRQINFFEVNKQFVLADLPGYGYAKISKMRKAEWRPLIEGYLKSSKVLAGVVLLLDVRHDPTPDDLQMLDFLAALGAPTIVVATKTDKMGPVVAANRIAEMSEALGLDADQMVAFSSRTGEGRDELAHALMELLKQPAWREEAETEPAPEDVSSDDYGHPAPDDEGHREERDE
ncbi:MAG: ribosome biogenesis GTP-binding protein YihA/YsxC [Gemmatimonadaceae bacterium]